jgi:hypothetical protein
VTWPADPTEVGRRAATNPTPIRPGPQEPIMKARMYYWGTTAATLVVLLESLGAGKKW